MAARGLGNLRNRWAIEPLKTALKDRDDGVRRAAQEALAKIQAPAPAPPAGKQQ
jgi:HEAT repeat protein